MSIVVIGLGKLTETIKALEKSAGKNVRSAYIAGGKLVESTAKKSIMNVSMGTYVTRYREGGASKQHIAAAPGNAPNNDTGRLVSSINTEVEEEWVVVGTTLEYGKHLEFGTENMNARPWLIPALNANNDMIIKLHRSAIAKSIKEIGNFGLKI